MQEKLTIHAMGSESKTTLTHGKCSRSIPLNA
jgi:hypothetical protein